MKIWLGGLALGLIIGIGAQAADDTPVAVKKYIEQFARDNDIEVIGIANIGGDSFTPPKKQLAVDRKLARALARYNYIVSYGDGRIVRVVILGQKGDSVGAMPDESLPPPMPEDAPQPETGSSDTQPQ